MSRASTPATSKPFCKTISCASPFGDVKLAVRPSWTIDVPFIQAQICCVFNSDLRVSTTAPQPSPRTYPSAIELNVHLTTIW